MRLGHPQLIYMINNGLLERLAQIMAGDGMEFVNGHSVRVESKQDFFLLFQIGDAASLMGVESFFTNAFGLLQHLASSRRVSSPDGSLKRLATDVGQVLSPPSLASHKSNSRKRIAVSPDIRQGGVSGEEMGRINRGSRSVTQRAKL